MPIPVIAVPLLIVAAACSRPPPVKALVIAGVEPLSIETDFRLGQLRALAKQANRVELHPPYGFYIGGVAYSISVTIGNEAHDVCVGPINIQVTMKLIARHIEVAQELKDDPCKFRRVVTHYQRHAEADEAVFERYVVLVTAALSHTPATSFVANLQAGSVRKEITQATQSVIEPVLASMDADRAATRAAVDTAAEVSRLEKVCTKQPRDEL